MEVVEKEMGVYPLDLEASCRLKKGERHCEELGGKGKECRVCILADGGPKETGIKDLLGGEVRFPACHLSWVMEVVEKEMGLYPLDFEASCRLKMGEDHVTSWTRREKNVQGYQIDVKTAFLYGKINEEVYVFQPPGFTDPKFPNKVYKVVKALYGLHQVPRAWYATLSTFLVQSGYRRGLIHKTLFIKKDKKYIMLDKYVGEILKKFDFLSVKTVSTPIKTKKPVVKDKEAANVDIHLYRSMLASLMYLTASRPNIIYLKGEPKLGLWDPRKSALDLEAYSDSDYAGANLDRKSTTRGFQFLSRRLISWQCKMQTIIATSTTEVEYVAAASYCRQILWIQNQILDYGFNFINTKIYIDNESTICIVKNLMFHSKTKHIEIRHQFIKDANKKKLIQVLKIHTDHNVADLLIKAFDVSRMVMLLTLGRNMQFGLVLGDLNGGHTSDRAEGALNLEELFSICTNLSNRVLALETVKDAQAAEIIALKARIKKLEKKWIKKDKLTLDDSTLDVLDADHGIDTEEPMNQGRLSEETKELVSTARPRHSSSNNNNKFLKPARSILTLKPLPTIDPKDKGKGVLEELEPTKKMTRSDLDAAQIAKDAEVAKLVYEEELVELEREKEKRQREEEASKAAIAEMYDKVQVGIEADALYGVECIYYRIFRSNRSSRWMKTFSEMVTRFDRIDLEEFYNLVMQRFETTSPEDVDLVLWGDLRTMFKETADDDLWKNQEE
uniref:Reverse transcriptase Ty1/copia-type domain-containing protein n=1 Tax=Tanacetum cinerariifolium TaxID=118510 RepID=A0A6L2ME82_TANCI|nr:hypothetical protein [Tanacetum cinerariifolium]